MNLETATTNSLTPLERRNTPAPEGSLLRFLASRTRGQALMIVALAMTVVVLFVGLGVDVGFLMAKRSKLQSAVDASALSAAQVLYGTSTQALATLKARQILEASGVPSNTLATVSSGTNPTVGFPGPEQVSVSAIQRVDTFFMRLIPIFSSINIDARAVADASSYAEIQAKPYGDSGVVNELNLMVWGKWSRRQNGDNYSPYNMPSTQAAPVRNTEYDKQPYGYLFRIDVPADYPSDDLVVQVFDADSYNRLDLPPTPSPTPTGVFTATVTPTPSPDNYAYCAAYDGTNCTTNNVRQETGVKLNAYPNGLPAFWRADEIRAPYYDTDNTYADWKTTTTKYSLWHFNRRNTTAFGDPYQLTDYAPGGVPGPIASIEVRDDSQYDLRWQQVFNIDMTSFERETNGKYYFYLYVQGVDGSSENNYDLRVGPNSSCTDLDSTPYNSPCYVNNIYWNAWRNGQAAATLWDDGGAKIFAKRALPLNLLTGAEFPILLAQISRNAAGQTLGVRHFDQDCNLGCGREMTYQMQRCGFEDLNDNASWDDIGTGYVGPNDGWRAPGNIPGTDPARQYPDPEPVKIPVEGSSDFRKFFENVGLGTSCDTSWLRIQTNPSYSSDTTVWELPFLRPRLIE